MTMQRQMQRHEKNRSCIFPKALIAALALLPLAACGTGISSLPKLAVATPGEAQLEIREYRLGSGDRLSIVIFGQPDLSGEFEVAGTGQVGMPLVGQIKADGLTVPEFQQAIATSLDETYLVDPRVSVEVVNYRPFYVLGEVNRPGRFDYASGIDVRQAIALAGGFTRRALQSAVKVIRDIEDKGRIEFEADPSVSVLPGDTIEAVRRIF